LLHDPADITCSFVPHEINSPSDRSGFRPDRVVLSVKITFRPSVRARSGSGAGVCAVLLFLCLCAAFRVPGLSAQAAAEPPLRLRPGDGIRLAVLDEGRLTADLTVLDDGTVLFPVIGLMRVTDADFTEIERRVREAYMKEVTTKHIVVRPLVRIAVLGEVRVPGLYVVDRTHDLADVLARAGGLAPSAARNRIMLIRNGETTRLDMNEGTAALHEGVRPGDQIVVERRGWVSENVPVLIGSATSILLAGLTALLVR
jgi:protein involved in polysaccharide export with SLBB domain